MQKLTIPRLLINCLTCIAMTSCGSFNAVKHYQTATLRQSVLHVPYFAQSDTDHIYKAHITVYGKALSGIFIAKKINDNTHRIVFSTEFGNTLMDFEISETNFRINSIVPELDRIILLNTLKTDFRLLLRSDYNVQQLYENDAHLVFKSRSGNKFDYLYTLKSTGSLFKIVHASKRKEIINIGVGSENNIFAQRISIEHKNIELTIELNRI